MFLEIEFKSNGKMQYRNVIDYHQYVDKHNILVNVTFFMSGHNRHIDLDGSAIKFIHIHND